MNLNDYIGEATAYDKKLMLERKDPTSWLKSVSAFANTQGGRLLFGVANDGSLAGLADAQGDAEFISETIKMQMDPVPETDFFLILPNLNYGRKINGVESSSEHFEHDTVNGIVNGTANGIVDGTEKIISTVVSTADRIIEAIRTNGQITYDGLAEVVGMSRRTISREIKALLSKGVIRRVGPDKTGQWEVVK